MKLSIKKQWRVKAQRIEIGGEIIAHVNFGKIGTSFGSLTNLLWDEWQDLKFMLISGAGRYQDDELSLVIVEIIGDKEEVVYPTKTDKARQSTSLAEPGIQATVPGGAG